MTEWVRLWHDMPTDPKWRVIARKSGQPLATVIAVFTFMLTSASSNERERGTLCSWDDEDVAAALDIDAVDVAAITSAMQGKVLDGERLSGWDRRQPKREDGSAERAAAFRERKRTQANTSDRTQPPIEDTDTDTDISLPNGSSTRPSAQVAPIGPKAGRGATLPDSWQPNEDHFRKADDRGVGRPWVNAQAGKMRDWAIANRNRAVARKADWDRTFAGWLDRELERASALPRAGPPQRESAFTQSARAIDRLFPDEPSHDNATEPEILPPAGLDQGRERFGRPAFEPGRGNPGSVQALRDFRPVRSLG